MESTKMIVLWCALGAPGLTLAGSPFDGTWRPDPQRPAPGAKPDSYVVTDGTYECLSCSPPYKIKADGADHPAPGPWYDSMSVKVIDARTLRKEARMHGQPVAETQAVVSEDGKTLTETSTLYGVGPKPLHVTSRSSRAPSSQTSGHAISGSWQRIETDLTNHDEDTQFRVLGGALSMSDKMGRSFTAKLDGTDAPYNGSEEYDSVSVRQLDRLTLEEFDKKDGKVVKIARWKVDPDGRTMHVEFDDTHGKLQHQSGHRIS